jgi:hypothetical protein
VLHDFEERVDAGWAETGPGISFIGIHSPGKEETLYFSKFSGHGKVRREGSSNHAPTPRKNRCVLHSQRRHGAASSFRAAGDLAATQFSQPREHPVLNGSLRLETIMKWGAGMGATGGDRSLRPRRHRATCRSHRPSSA